MSGLRPIPVNTPLLDGNERKYLLECLDSGWISSEGPFVAAFEEKFAARVGRKHGIAVANGSVALDAAIVALQLPAGGEVLMPAFTIISCAAAIVRAGLVPVLVDADPETWNMDVAALAPLITAKTRAIMVVHIYGLSTDMDPVLLLAEKHGLKVIEDAAEAHGLTYRGRPCGSFGAMSIFSFYPNKHITTGEGGMIVTDDAALAERCRSLRNLCFQPQRRFVHEELGWNFRMTNLQAALGLAQLESLERHLELKRAMGRRYQELLGGLPGVQLPPIATPWSENLYWVFGLVLLPAVPFDAAEAMSRLAEKKVGTRPFFWPMHEQPVLRRMGLFEGASFPVAEMIARRGFYIPSGLGLSDEDMVAVAARVREVLG
jgi:perosamine synthetase